MALVHYTKEEEEEKKKKERGERAREGWAAKQQSKEENRKKYQQQEQEWKASEWGTSPQAKAEAARDLWRNKGSGLQGLSNFVNQINDPAVQMQYADYMPAMYNKGGLLQSNYDNPVSKFESDYQKYAKAMDFYKGMAESAVKYKDEDLYNTAEAGYAEASAGATELWGKTWNEAGKSRDYSGMNMKQIERAQKQDEKLLQYANVFGTEQQKILARRKLDKGKEAYGKQMQAENPAEYYATTMSEVEVDKGLHEAQERLDAAQAAYDAKTVDQRPYYQGGQYVDTTDEMAALKAAQDEVATWKAAQSIQRADKDVQTVLKLEQQADTPDKAQKAKEGKEAWLIDITAGTVLDKFDLSNVRSAEGVAGKIQGLKTNILDTAATVGDFFGVAVDRATEGRRDNLPQWAQKLLSKDPNWMSADELETFYALYATDKNAALQYSEIIQDNNKNETFAEWRKKLGGNPLTRYAAWGYGNILGLASGLDPFGRVGQELSEASEFAYSVSGQGLKEHGILNTGIGAGELGEDWGVLEGKSLADVSQLAGSMAQSFLLAYGAGAVGSALEGAGFSANAVKWGTKAAEFAGTALMGASAAASDYRESLKRGLTDRDAKAHAICAGVAEAAFEYISLDKLVNTDVARGLIRTILVQGGVEASEEMCTTIANRITDEIMAGASGHDSKLEQRRIELIAEGMSPEEAKKKAEAEWATDLLFDAVGGFLSGGFMGGGAYITGGGLQQTGQWWDNKIANVTDVQNFGELGLVPQQYRDTAWEQAALDRTGAGKTLTVETPTANLTQRVQMQTDGVSAIESYAKDNGITVKGTDTDLTKSGQRKQNRAFSQTVEQTVSSIETQMEKAGSIDAAAKVHAELVSKYGDGIRTVADEALTRASYTIASRDSGSVSAAIGEGGVFQQARAISDEKAAEAATKGVNAAVAVKGTYTEDQAENRAADTHLFRERLRTSNSNVDLNVSLTSEDGSERTGEIRGWSNDGRNLVLTDGTVVAPESVHGNADTMNAVQYLKQAGLGAATNVVWQKYLTSGALSTEDAATWIGNYVAAVNDGKAGVLTLKQSQERSKLDAETAKEAYELGEKLAEEEISRKETENAEKRKNTKEGATGKKGILDTSRVSKAALDRAYSDKATREQLRMIEVIANALGVDIRLFDSTVKNGRYQGENGRYRRSGNYIEIDINAARHAVTDIRAGILAVTGHELTHWMQENAPREYRAYRTAVVQALIKTEGQDGFDALVHDQMSRNKSLTETEAIDEVVADASISRLQDKAFWDVVADRLSPEEQKTIKAQIKQFVKDWFARIRDFLEGTPQTFLARDAINKAEAEVQKNLADLFAKGISKAAENAQGTKNPATEGGEKQYSARDFGLEEFDKETKNNIKMRGGVIVNNDAELDAHILAAISGTEKKNLYLGAIAESTKRLMEQETGKTLFKKKGQYTYSLSYDDIRHIYNRHYNSVSKTREAVKIILGMLADHDNIQAYTTNNGTETRIRLDKTLPNADYLTINVVSSGKRALDLVTVYITKKHSGSQSVQAAGSNIPASSSPGSTSTNPSIAQTAQNSNTQNDQKSSRDNDEAYLELAKDPVKNEAKLQEMVDEAAEKAGYKVRGWHGTTNFFTVFDKSRANPEGDSGAGFYFTTNEDDVAENYANNEGADLTNRIEHLADMLEYSDEYEGYDHDQLVEIARKRLSEGNPRTISAALRVENPAVLGDGHGLDSTFLDFEENYDEEADEYGEPEGLLVDFVEALKDIASDYVYRQSDLGTLDEILYEYGMDDGGISAEDAVEMAKDRLSEIEVTDENGDLIGNEIVRQALEQIGFDAIVDNTVYHKFRRMPGMRPGTTHIIVFNPSQIKVTDPVTYDNNGKPIPLSERFNASNEDIRYSERDNEYLQAVEDGDEAKQERIVRQAANRAGYNSPLLYHGTSDFGFTTFDLERGERLIFATSNLETAKTYSGDTKRNRINQKKNIRVDALEGKALLDEANKHLDGRYDGYTVMTDREKQTRLKKAQSRLAEFARLAEEFKQDNIDAFGQTKSDTFDAMVREIRNMAKAKTESELQKAYTTYIENAWDFKWMDESMNQEFESVVKNRDLVRAFRDADELMYGGDLFVNKSGKAPSYSNSSGYVFDNQIALELEAALDRGVYQLYGKMGRSLSIDAHGANWNAIMPPEELHLDGPSKTRDIAQAAFDLGYDSVEIKNVYDNSDGTDYRGKGDIYIFNAKNAVKSADPVTYDDAGKPIPLSERFNTENEDIRYSERDRLDVDTRRNDPLDGQVGMFGEDGSPVYQQTKKQKTAGELFTDRLAEFMVEKKKNGGWWGNEFDKFYDEHPEMDFVRRFMRNDSQVREDMERFVATVDDPQVLENLKWYSTQSSRNGKNARGSVTKVRNIYKARINEILTQLNNGRKITLERRRYSFNEVKELFNELNTNDAVKKLAEKVFDVTKDLGLSFYATNKWYGERDADALGANKGKDVFLRINAFANTAVSDQEKASTIIHELIHACTAYAIDAYENHPYTTKLNPRVMEAVQMLEKIYGQARGEELLANSYGMKNLKEFVAEIAQPRFRDKLHKLNLWDRIRDAICKFFGIERVKGKTYLDSAAAALDFLLEEMDRDELDRYYRMAEREVRTWEQQTGEERFSSRDYDQPTDMDLIEGIDQSEATTPEAKALLRENQAKVRQIRELTRKLERVQAELRGYEGESPDRISVKDFVQRSLDMFGIAKSDRNDVSGMLQSIAEGVLAGHNLTRDDVMSFFEMFVSQGKQRSVTDEYLEGIRNDLKGRRIYVNEETKADFGDDWNAFRRRAFGLGIQLTNNEKNAGVDMVNAELAADYPGSFDANETDMRAMLENMVDTAESGKTSEIPMLEAMRQVEKQEGVPVREQLQDLLDRFTRQIEIMKDRAAVERKARAGNAAEIAKAKQQAAKAAETLKEVRKERDAWKRKATGAEARQAKALDKALRQVIQHDAKQLVAAIEQKRQVEAKLQKQLEREEKILAGKLKPAAMQKMLTKAKEEAAAKVKQQKTEQFERYKEGKKATELRGKIRNLTDEIRRTATKPTERNFLPAHLADAMVELLDMLEAYGIDTPKPGTKAAEKYYSAADGIRKLSDAYLEMKNDPDYTWSSEFDQDVYDGLVKLAKQFQKTTKDGYSYTATMSDLTLAEMQQVYDTIKEIRDGMRNAARMIGLEGSRSVYDYGNSIIQNQRELQKLKNDKSKLGRKVSRLMGTVQLDALSAMRAAHMIGGGGDSAIYQLWKHIEDGLGTKNRVIMESNKMLQDLKTGKNEQTYLKAMRDKVDYGIKDVNGKTVMLTPMQALQIYMTWQREVANDRLVHMQEGGIIVRDAELLAKGKFEEAETTKQNVKVTPETIRKIENKLTSWDRAYMQASRNVFDSLLKQSNKVLYELKHKVHQGEKNYIPEKVSSDYLQQEVVKGGEFNLGIKEAGATKDLVQRSTLPIVIDGLETLLNHHINEMANYIGLAMPIRNFAKVYNMRTQGIGVDAATVNGEISNTWGGKAGQMMMDTLREIQNGKTYQYDTVMGKAAQKLQSAFVKASLVGKISVTIKQAASFAAAGSVLSQKALDRSQQYILPIFMAPNSKLAKRIYDRIDSRTAENYIRRQGLSMEEIAMDKLSRGPVKDKLQRAGAWMEKSTVGKYARRALSWLNPTNWIQRMDVATTTALVIACEKQAKYDGFKKGTQAYEDHVTELYERVIRETQPMYDALHRPEMQKNAPDLVKLTMPFRTVPFQNYGQIMDSFMMYANAERTGTKAEKVAAAKHVGKTLWANAESAFIFAALSAVAAAIRHKPKRYMDDDDELTVESVMKAYGLDVLDVAIGNLMPYGGTELKDIAERVVNGDKWYDVFSVGSVELANTYVKSIANVFNTVRKHDAGEASEKDIADAVKNLAWTSAKFFGFPAENVRDIVTGVKADITDLYNGKLSIDRTGATNARRFIKALEAGDQKKADAVMAEMRENILKDKPGLKEEKVNKRIQGYVTSYIKEQYEAGNMSEAKATKYLVEHGTAEDENDAYWKIREWDARAAWTGPSEEFSFSKFTEMREILSEGGDISDEVERLTSHGVTFETVNKEIGEAIQELYEDGKLSKEEATQMLVKYHKTKDDGEYRPDTKNEAYWKADEWEAKQEYGDDYNDSNYRDLYAAIDGNKDPAAAVKELKDHGYSEEQIRDAAKKRLVNNYVAGGVTESAFRNQLSRYCGIVVKDDVNKIVNDANCRKQYGVSYSQLDDEYRAGNITKTETRSALMKYGGLSGEEADKKIRWYDLQKANPNLTVTESGCNTWYDGTAKTRENGHESAKAAGMSIENYLKAKETLSGISDANGNGTGEDEYIAALSKMTGLTSRQKDALYYEKYKGTTKYSRKTW